MLGDPFLSRSRDKVFVPLTPRLPESLNGLKDTVVTVPSLSFGPNRVGLGREDDTPWEDTSPPDD